MKFSDLFEFIEKNGAAEESVAHRIFTQLVSAVRYLARNQIIHRDIKDENIIIDPNLNIELIGKRKKNLLGITFIQIPSLWFLRLRCSDESIW